MRHGGWPAGLARLRLAALAVALLLSRQVLAQTLEVRLPATVGDPRTPQVMRDLAERIIPSFREADRQRYLATLSYLQEVAGSWSAAYAARLSLAELTHRLPADVARTPDAVYELHLRARALQEEEHGPYREALARSFQSLAGSIDDLTAYHLAQWVTASPAPQEAALQRAFDAHRGQDRITLASALDLIQAYGFLNAQRSVAQYAGEMVAADQARRYVIDELHIPVGAGVSIGAVVVRPRAVTKPLPAVLTPIADPQLLPSARSREQAVASAAHGYVGVVASARTWEAPPGPNGTRAALPHIDEPYTHEGEDARSMIRWISAQPFSDGRVAMAGQDYGAFAAFAAARNPPSALRALVVASATAPGINMPMEGSIFRSEAYRWLLYVTRAPGVDEDAYRDTARWRDLENRWFASGKPFAELDRLFGVPSPIFQRWLMHPSLDDFWHRRLPSARELSQLSMPVLTLTGYYDPGEAGALYYFKEHRRLRPKAEHVLLAGPYDAEALAGAAPPELAGYPLEASARVDLTELRYQWLDHVLRGTGRPALLSGTVNYEVMGADSWRHVDQLPASKDGLTLYLAPGGADGPQQLVPEAPARSVYLEQNVNFANREAVDLQRPAVLSGSFPVRDAMLFVSAPLQQPMELAGQPLLHLLLSLTSQDVDLTMTLFEQLPDGRYLRLHGPPYEQRLSYASDPATRNLLMPRRVTPVTLNSSRMLAVKMQAGSRLVLLLGVKKRPDEEINHGTGGDVSRESAASATAPVRLRWYGGSYVQVPTAGQ